MTLTNIDHKTIPIHIRGGSIVPLRIESANTTTELRKKNFHILIAPDLNGMAGGSLYLDDGISIVQPLNRTSDITFLFVGNIFAMKGSYGYDAGVQIEKITLLNQTKLPAKVDLRGEVVPGDQIGFVDGRLEIQVAIPLTGNVDLVMYCCE